MLLGAIGGLITAATPIAIVLIRRARQEDRRIAALEKRVKALEQRPCVERDAAFDAELARVREDIQRMKAAEGWVRRPSQTNER